MSLFTQTIASARNAKLQNYLAYAGGTAYLNAPHTLPTDAFTVVMVYKTTSATPGSNDTMIGQAGSLQWFRQSTNDNQMYAYLNASGDFAGARRLRIGRSMTNFTGDNRWHRRVWVVFVDTADNKGTVREFEDGVFKKQSKTDYTGDTTTPSGDLYLGNFSNSSSFSMDNMGLRETMIFHQKLSDAEVAGLESGTLPYVPQRWWRMGEGQGSTITDDMQVQNL